MTDNKPDNKNDSPNSKYEFNKKTYNWWLSSIAILEKALGINIHVHQVEKEDGSNILNDGQIFLFNHFARFETIIPPFVLYRENKSLCRTIADHKLFGLNKGLDKFMMEGGATPSNLPGLLPFLAAEILRGRKVSIFPEGSMIKDRRVLDDEGNFGIMSRINNKYKKHHRGAAVLALTLDLFKRRIKDLFASNDTVRIDHWREALGFASNEEMLAQVNKPTLIIPGNITFNPIRSDDNVITKYLNKFTENPSEKALEEMSIEGNLLFDDTDMDIRFGEAIHTEQHWNWWNKVLLNKYFLSIDSLDELFGLKENAESWSERMLVKSISKQTLSVRDAYMKGIYQETTINLSHIASNLILQLNKAKIKKITQKEFHKALYITIKNLQNEKTVHLYRGIDHPKEYKGLLNGDNKELAEFINICTKAELIEITADNYYNLTSKLNKGYKFHKIRINNPVQLYANESAPIKAIKKEALKTIAKIKDSHSSKLKINELEKEISKLLFDDELREHKQNLEHHGSSNLSEINALETATKSGQPYFLHSKKQNKSKSNAKIGVLMVHGFLASPAELEDFAKIVHKKGYPVLGVRLTGHGTSPHCLEKSNWQDWLESVKQSYKILSSFSDNIIIIGFSAGGTLSLLHSLDNPDKLAGIISVGAPLDVRKPLLLASIVHPLNSLISWIPGINGFIPYQKSTPENPDINYRTIPVRSLNQFRIMVKTLHRNLKKITVPVTIIQSTDDPVIEPDSAQIIHDEISSTEKELHWIESDVHSIITRKVGDTHKIILSKIKEIDKKLK